MHGDVLCVGNIGPLLTGMMLSVESLGYNDPKIKLVNESAPVHEVMSYKPVNPFKEGDFS